MKRLSLVFTMMLGVVLVAHAVFAQDIPSEESASTESSEAGELTPEGKGEEEVPILEEGEGGEVTERGIRRFKFQPRKPAQQSRPRILIPQKPRPKVKVVPERKLRITPGKQATKPSQPGGQGPPASQRFIPKQVIVKLRPGMSLPSSTMRAFGLKELRRTSGGHVLFQFVVPPGLEKLRNPLAVAQELAKHAEVIFAEPNFVGQPDRIPQDELFKHQWHYFENGTGVGQSPGGIGLPKVWDRTRGSRNVVVAVIDTGIVGHEKEPGKLHPDIELKNLLLPGFDFITDVKNADDGDGRDANPTDPGDARKVNDLADCKFLFKPGNDTWHGTSMAGIVGLGKTNNSKGVAGVNWQVSILPIRVSGKCGYENFDLYDAIRWAAGLPTPDAGVNPNPARIMNISLGGIGPCPKLIQEAIDEVMKTKRVSIVAGAGNESTLAAFHHPSNCKSVISVAASDERGHLASYSNFGSAVTIMAPGGNRLLDVNKDKKFDQVLALYHFNDKDPKIDDIPLGYAFGAGTSNAAPHVSGVLALWLAEDFSLTHEELLTGLKEKAFKRDRTQCPRLCGAGLLNGDLSSLIKPGKAVPPPPLKKGPPPKKTPPVSQCTIKTTDIVHSLKIDIGNNDSQTTSAKQAMFRMLIHGDVATRREASSMVKATETGALAGIFQRNKGPVAARGQRMAPKKGWWELIPQGQRGMCLTEPTGESPMIIYREQDMAPSELEDTLKLAWRQCGLPTLPFPCAYEKDLGNKPQTNRCLDQAEKAYLQGEKQCDAKFGSQKACRDAFSQCLKGGKGVVACSEAVPCTTSQAYQGHLACMTPFETQRDQAEELCEE